MDGRVLSDAYVEGYMEAFPVKIAETADTGGPREDGVGYTEDGEAEIMERLRGLGYMG
jgi:hypothetical protein